MTNTDKSIGPGKDIDESEDGTDPIIGKAVGNRLKNLYTEFTDEEVPDRFLDLINKLEEKEEADKGRSRLYIGIRDLTLKTLKGAARPKT